ncbi:ATP-dependent RNA helicase [Rhizopus azygosporus]|uniref:RNA helicase n=1 Tax=Rhizopus azygosporus TaxID=86630 RepID=A0A367KG38_RHIAZ|nr:ATP-dependent RNA helicase [Rhizopus azygosporus]
MAIKKKNNNNLKKKKSQIEYEELTGDINSWDWSESAGTSDAFLTDDVGGFLCLEEISDVEIEYEGDETTGKVAKFKRIKKTDRKPTKKAEPTAPLSIEETGKYYDLDTFDEELAAKTEDDTKGNKDSKIVQGEIDTVEDEIERDDMEITDTTEKPNDDNKQKESETQSKKTKAQKLLEKKKKDLERLMAQVKKLEEEVEVTEKEPKKEEEKKKPEGKKRPTVDDIDTTVDVSAWNDLQLAEPIVNALKYHKFSTPTPIQEKTLPLALSGRDIVGSAETGSGKTLAFGIPIVHYLATHQKEGLAGLILTPTRELAIQVKEHISNIALFTDTRCVAIVGGMSVQKQERLLKNKPDIIVATPGRLWELFSSNQEYMDMLKHIKFLVLDEADRMLEKGHFEELTNILNSISTKRQSTTDWPEQVKDGTRKVLPQDLGVHQTFIFTATLNKDIRFNVKTKKRKITPQPTGTMDDLLSRIEFADQEPALIDITSENMVASRLLEAKIECLQNEKDMYVYYFVTRYPGRTIIFVNSIDSIRRLVPVFKLLNIEVLGLHAQMQQKQRLKNLDRFKANDKAVLVASDVAARGLDIPLVGHVIHYQLPRSGEIYVHRSGRTARANRDGVSLLLCGPEETKVYQKLCQTLRKGEEYPMFPVDLNILRSMKERVELARQIDSIQHRESKQAHEQNWMRKLAQEMDVDFDEDMMQGNGHQKSNKELQREKAKVNGLKNQLNQLLQKPILPAGVSRKFLTGGLVSGLVDRLIENKDQKVLPASTNTKAVDDLHTVKKRKTNKSNK